MKKKFKFTESVANDKFAYKPGDEAFLDADQAKAWEACGYGAIIESEKK